MPRGGARPGAGRPNGSKTRPDDVRLAERAARAARMSAATQAPPDLARKCPICEKSFVRPRSGQGLPLKFCSVDCRKIGYTRGSEIPCPTCCEPFRPDRWNGQTYCSASCRRNPGARIWPSEKEARAAAQDRRRARKFGVGYERFWRRSIYERDGWLCQICSLPVDRSSEPDRHLRPSLDHKVPLSRGGAHSRENVQCAHWICNSRKTHSPDGGLHAGELMKAEYATRWSEAGRRPQAKSEQRQGESSGVPRGESLGCTVDRQRGQEGKHA